MKNVNKHVSVSTPFNNICQRDGLYSPDGDFSTKENFKEGQKFPEKYRGKNVNNWIAVPE